MAGRIRCSTSPRPDDGSQLHDAEPEGGHRLTQERHDGGHVVHGRVAAHRRDDAGRDGQTESEQEPGAGQLEGGGQPLEHESHGRFAVTQRVPEVAPERALEEAQVLHGHGIVEPHGLAELGEVFGGGVGRQQQERRVARQMEDEEDDDRDTEEHQTRLPAAAQQVRLHTVLGHSAGGFAPLPKPPPGKSIAPA